MEERRLTLFFDPLMYDLRHSFASLLSAGRSQDPKRLDGGLPRTVRWLSARVGVMVWSALDGSGGVLLRYRAWDATR